VFARFPGLYPGYSPLQLEPGTASRLRVVCRNEPHRSIQRICNLASQCRFAGLSWSGNNLDESPPFFEPGFENVELVSLEHGGTLDLLNTLSKCTHCIE
jgi:hypothetical protein